MRLVDIDDIRVMKFLSEDEDPSESDGEREYRNGWNDALTAVNDIQPSVQPELATDCIRRQAAIDVVDSETVSTNPEHFKSSEKFIKFMDDADIASFGKWQWANGFNTALTATTIQLKNLPSAEPVRCKECKFYDHFWNGDWCSLKNIDVEDANDFCSRAERRTDE